MSEDARRLLRAAQMLAGLREAGPRPVCLPEEFAPRNEDEAYRLQQQVASTLGARIGGFKVAMTGANAGSYAPVFASELHATGIQLSSPIRPQLGIEPEVAFTLGRDLPALPAGQRYEREQVIDAIVGAHAAIEILVSRFQKHETAPLLDRLADNISNGGLVLGRSCPVWRDLDLSTLALTLTIDTGRDEVSIYESRGGHPSNDPLIPLVWLANHRSDLGVGLTAGTVVTTGSYAGLRYVEPGARVEARFAGLGAVELYS